MAGSARTARGPRGSAGPAGQRYPPFRAGVRGVHRRRRFQEKHMKFRSDKWLAATGLLAAGALLAACGSADDSAAPSSTTESATSTTSASDSTTTTTEKSGAGSDDSAALIEAAVDGGDPVVCDMEIDGGTGQAHIRALDSMRVEIDDVEMGEMTMLLAGGEVYIWAPEDTRSVALGPAMAAEMAMVPEVEGLLDGEGGDGDCQGYDGGDEVCAGTDGYAA